MNWNQLVMDAPTGQAADSFAAFRHARATIALHCHPERGAPYWIEKAKQRGIDVHGDINRWEDIHRFGWMDEEAMRSRPIADFIPKAVLHERAPLIYGETSGFMGKPKSAAFAEEEFEAAFVRPFEAAAAAVGFPLGGAWLFVGPTGPHPIGRAARRLARRFGSGDAFVVDFDPRWFNALAPESFARQRYLNHLAEQALTILGRERIDVIFATPSTLEALAERMSDAMRETIAGIHYGGQALLPDRRRKLEFCFPRAVHLAGYGNSLFGVCMELNIEGRQGPCYFPCGDRLRLRVLNVGDRPTDSPAECVEVADGERGRIVFDRFDRTQMILNLLERDEATRIVSPARTPRLGYAAEGVERPELARCLRAEKNEGIY